MIPERLKKIGSILTTLLLALAVAAANPIAAYVFFSCFLSSFVFCNMTGGRESEGWDQKV
jgi:hypothetical protein